MLFRSQDAAGIGFDDDHIYREMSVPIAARAVPMNRLLAEEAAGAFRQWRAKPDKIRY